MKLEPIAEQDLHAMADNRLAPARRAELNAWLASHSREAAQVEAWRAQNALIHRAYDDVLAQPLPARLRDAARSSGRFSWQSLSTRRLAAAVAWLAVGGVIGFFVRGESPFAASSQTSLPRQAAIAHAVFAPEVRHPVEVGAEQESHLAAWLSKRLGAPLKPPHLEAAGYSLLGGRLLAGEGADGEGNGAVAQFMYQNGRGARLTLYVRHAARAPRGDAGFSYAREGGIGVFYWIDGPFGYALAGEADKPELLKIATIVYSQISP